MNRRYFLNNALSATLAGIAGSNIVFKSVLPPGYVPLLWQDATIYEQFHKDQEMIILNDKPINMEAPAHLLDQSITPAEKMFVRNNGLVPEQIGEERWELEIEGESVLNKKMYRINDLKNNFNNYSYQLVLECAGNGRSEFSPPAKGNQWTIGAISCAVWTGIRLRDLLEEVGIKPDAKYVAYFGNDLHLSKEPGKYPISRGIPMAKAMQDETLIAFEMNGEPIPLIHGHPLRLIAGGWPASASGKWLNKLSVRNIIHDGEKMGGQSYRVPCHPVMPGSEVDDMDMCIIESMPVKSIITSPKTGAIIRDSSSLNISGHAWAGELAVSKMEYSINFGATWQNCELKPPVNRLAWQDWTAKINFPDRGYYEIWARATDENNITQPSVLPGWNPRGYLNNACHRIAVKII